jgi:hypothetical protein
MHDLSLELSVPYHFLLSFFCCAVSAGLWVTLASNDGARAADDDEDDDSNDEDDDIDDVTVTAPSDASSASVSPI